MPAYKLLVKPNGPKANTFYIIVFKVTFHSKQSGNSGEIFFVIIFFSVAIGKLVKSLKRL